MVLFNPIVISVLVLTVLCLFKLPVLAALLLAALTAGLAGGFNLTETMTTFYWWNGEVMLIQLLVIFYLVH